MNIEEFILNQWSFYNQNDTLNYSLLENKPNLEEILDPLNDFLKTEVEIKDNSRELKFKIVKFYVEIIKTYEVKKTETENEKKSRRRKGISYLRKFEPRRISYDESDYEW